MDWKSRRITALLEAALIEDKAANDVTTALTIDPNMRATATIVAKQSCVVAGIGCISAFLSLYGKLSTKPVGRFEVVSHRRYSTASASKKVRPSPSSAPTPPAFSPPSASSST